MKYLKPPPRVTTCLVLSSTVKIAFLAILPFYPYSNSMTSILMYYFVFIFVFVHVCPRFVRSDARRGTLSFSLFHPSASHSSLPYPV